MAISNQHRGRLSHSGFTKIDSNGPVSPKGSSSANVDLGAGGNPSGDGADAEVGQSSVVYKVYKRRWFGLLQLTLLNIIVSWDWLTYSPVVKNAAKFYRTDETTINWLSTAFLFSFVAVCPLTILALHRGVKLSIMVAAALILAGNWIRYAGSFSKDGSDHFGVVMFGQILTGFAQPFVLAAPTRYSDLWFTNSGRVAATAVMSLANPFGAAIGQLVNPMWVNDERDISKMVLYVSIISTVCCLPSFFIPAEPPTPVAPSATTSKMSLRSSMKVLSGSPEFWLVFIPFSIYVASFNAVSSLLSQIMTPYNITEDEAGIGGALLIVVGLVSSAITSPIIDRTKRFILSVKVAVPVIGLCYLVFVWMPETGKLPGPYVVLAILGAASFSLVPIALELLIELSHPISPEVTSVLSWSGGQLLGGIFIIIEGALKDNNDNVHPGNMKRALIFQAVLALVVIPLPLSLGLFGRQDAVRLRRVTSDDAGGIGATPAPVEEVEMRAP